MVSTPNTPASPHPPTNQHSRLPISKFSPSHPGASPGPNHHLLTNFTTFECGHKTTEFAWIPNGRGDEGRTHKPVWEAKEGRCAGCCWKRGVGALQNKLNDRKGKDDEKDIEGGDEVVKEFSEMLSNYEGKEEKSEFIMFMEGFDKAIEEVEMVWENAVADIEVRKKDAEKRTARLRTSLEEEAEKGEKSAEESEQLRINSVVIEGRMWEEPDDTVSSPTTNGSKKKKGEKEVVKRKGEKEEKKKTKKEEGEGDVVVSGRLSKEEKKRNRVVGDMIERNEIVGAWGLLRGEVLDIG